MRVAHVVASYHPRVGGVETHVRRIAEACASAGDEVTVLTHAAGPAPVTEDAGAVRVLRFPETVRSVRYPLSLPLFRYLASHAGEFEVAHAHSYHTLVGQAAVRSGLPFVFTPHYHGTGHTMAASLMHRVYRPVGARVLAGADAIICVSQAERDLVAGDFPAIARKVRVIPNGTDPRAAAVRGPGPPSGAADSADGGPRRALQERRPHHQGVQRRCGPRPPWSSSATARTGRAWNGSPPASGASASPGGSATRSSRRCSPPPTW